MWILWKMRFWKGEFCEKWDFENVNCVKYENFKMWFFRINWGFLPQCVNLGNFMHDRLLINHWFFDRWKHSPGKIFPSIGNLVELQRGFGRWFQQRHLQFYTPVQWATVVAGSLGWSQCQCPIGSHYHLAWIISKIHHIYHR